MSEIITVGLDLANHVFQVHGADASGRAVLHNKLRRDQVLVFFSQLQALCCRDGSLWRRTFRCVDLRFWGREIGNLGHDVRLIPPANLTSFLAGYQGGQPPPRAKTGVAPLPVRGASLDQPRLTWRRSR